MLLYKKYISVCLAICFACMATAQEEKKPLLIDLSYNVKNNQYPYLVVFTKTKVEKQFPPVPNTEVSIYMNEESDAMLLGKIKTDASGKGLVTISGNFKSVWDSSDNFKFLAFVSESKIYESTEAEINITKATISVDSVEGAETRTLSASVIEQLMQGPLPAKEVELKIIVKRMAGNLSVGDGETYTTDSTGVALAEFKRDSIPGDQEGFIVVIAKTEDNDTYGNISIEKKIRWGAVFTAANNFDKRTLFATRDKSPVWLLALAYSIAIGVWGTIAYLVWMVVKIRKAGLQHTTI